MKIQKKGINTEIQLEFVTEIRLKIAKSLDRLKGQKDNFRAELEQT